MTALKHAVCLWNAVFLCGARAKEKIQTIRDSAANEWAGALTDSASAAIKDLWKHAQVQEYFNSTNEFKLDSSAGYFFQSIERVLAPDYVPSEQDVLRTRKQTTGLIEQKFAVEGHSFSMIDVGGQRNQRRYWAEAVKDVTAVLFVSALSEYDQKLVEDRSVNRMHESLVLFEKVANSPWFKNSAVILFLNKMDLFAEKVKQVDPKVCFEEYNGGCDYDAAVEFITEKFLQCNKNPEKKLYIHVTCATNTENIRFVFEAVKEVVLMNNLRDSGLL